MKISVCLYKWNWKGRLPIDVKKDETNTNESSPAHNKKYRQSSIQNVETNSQFFKCVLEIAIFYQYYSL